MVVARDKITACNSKLERYRAALEAGTDPVLVQQWIAETQAAKSIVESDIRALLKGDWIGTHVRFMRTDVLGWRCGDVS